MTVFMARTDLMPNPAGTTNAIFVNDGAWHHLTGVLDSSDLDGVVKLYVDGILQISATNTSAPLQLLPTDRTTSIAAREYSPSSGYDRAFTGRLDDVRIYNRALSASDVQELYASVGTTAPEWVVTLPSTVTNYVLTPTTMTVLADGTVPVSYQWQWYGTNLPSATNRTYVIPSSALTDSGPYSVIASNAYGTITNSTDVYILDLAANDYTTALVADWRFDEISGTVAADSSGKMNNLDLFNFPADNSQWVPSPRGGGALRINSDAATDDYLLNPSVIVQPFNSNFFTFSFWIKLDNATTGPNPRIISVNNGAHWVLWKSVAPNIGVGFYQPGASVLPQVNKWTHYTVTVNRSSGNIVSYSLYVNGVKVVDNKGGYTGKPAPTGFWKIAHAEGAADTEYFRGQLDDMKMYNRMLTDSQVAALYASYPGYLVPLSDPQDALVSERSPATFSITADGTSLSYQWQKNGENIAGATSSTLVLPDVLMADDQSKYRVIVSNTQSNYTSPEATLFITPLPVTDLTGNLVAHYKFDDAAGLQATNAAGSVHAALSNFPEDNSQWQTGIIGGALRFGETNQFAEIADYNNFQFLSFPDADKYTFSFWAKADATGQGANPRFLAGAGQHWVTWRRGAPAGLGFYNPSPSPVPASDAWTHFVVSYDRAAGKYTLFVNGVRAVFEATSASYVKGNPNDLPWIVGHSENLAVHTESFRGLMDDLRIYNRRLNTPEAEALYLTAPVPPAPPIITMYRNGATLTFSWPSWASGYTLKSSTSLDPSATWSTVVGTPVLTNLTPTSVATMIQTDTIGEDTLFYRLAK
jgi:hypothetical protein